MAKGKTTISKSASTPAAPRRSVFVAAGLLITMGLTSGVLLALAPQPLAAPSSRALLASQATSTLKPIFATPVPVQPDRWTAIYVHTGPQGEAETELPDHFVIADGVNAPDGQVQIGRRWDHQLSALPPAGTASIRQDVISVRLMGDFDRTAPTAVQMQRLTTLLQSLRQELDLPAQAVHIDPAAGRFFPADVMQVVSVDY